MPRNRSEVEPYYEELNRKFLETKDRILKTLGGDPDQLYSVRELFELFGTLPYQGLDGQVVPGTLSQEDMQRIGAALNTLLQEGKAVLYKDPHNTDPHAHPVDVDLLGINKNPPDQIVHCANCSR